MSEVTGVAVDARNTVVAVRRSDPPIIELNPAGKILKTGRFLEQWTQFGRLSGLLITADDTLYVADVQDKKGIVYGNAKDGTVRGVIEGTLPESIAIDRDGSVYAGETTTGHTLRKFLKP